MNHLTNERWDTFEIRPNDQNVMGKRVDGRCDIQFCRRRFQQWNADRLFNLRYSCFSKKCISMLTLFFMSCTHTFMHNAQFTMHKHTCIVHWCKHWYRIHNQIYICICTNCFDYKQLMQLHTLHAFRLHTKAQKPKYINHIVSNDFW